MRLTLKIGVKVKEINISELENLFIYAEKQANLKGLSQNKQEEFALQYLIDHIVDSITIE